MSAQPHSAHLIAGTVSPGVDPNGRITIDDATVTLDTEIEVWPIDFLEEQLKFKQRIKEGFESQLRDKLLAPDFRAGLGTALTRLFQAEREKPIDKVLSLRVDPTGMLIELPRRQGPLLSAPRPAPAQELLHAAHRERIRVMLRTPAWLRPLPYAAICLSFSATLSAAEAPAEAAPGSVARTAPPGCAKLVCQRRGPAADLGTGTERREAEGTASTVAVRLGVGAGAFRLPRTDVVWLTVSQSDGGPREFVLGPPTVEELSLEIEGAAVSLGVSLAQPLASTGSLRWGLEERLSLMAVLPLAGGSLIGGFADVLVDARVASLPLRLGLGPSLGVAMLEAPADFVSLDEQSLNEPAVMVGAAAVLALDLGELLPGTLELVGHLGKALTYEGASHRDLQLAFAVPL